MADESEASGASSAAVPGGDRVECAVLMREALLSSTGMLVVEIMLPSSVIGAVGRGLANWWRGGQPDTHDNSAGEKALLTQSIYSLVHQDDRNTLRAMICGSSKEGSVVSIRLVRPGKLFQPQPPSDCRSAVE